MQSLIQNIVTLSSFFFTRPMPCFLVFFCGDKRRRLNTICTVRAGVESVTMRGIHIIVSDTKNDPITLKTEQNQQKMQATAIT